MTCEVNLGTGISLFYRQNVKWYIREVSVYNYIKVAVINSALSYKNET